MYAIQDKQTDKFLYLRGSHGLNGFVEKANLVNALDAATLFLDKAEANEVACNWSNEERLGYLGSFRCVKIAMTCTPEPWI